MDRYYLADGTHQGGGYRLLWIRSTQKAEQDDQTRDRHLAKALEGLKAVQSRLNTYNLKSRQAIDQAIEKILQKHQTRDWIEYHIDARREYREH
jgi:transposase